MQTLKESEDRIHKMIEEVEDYAILLLKREIFSTGIKVLGKPIQLHQLFSNIICNAIKFNNNRPVIEIKWENILFEDLNG
ncbi:MAG: hypothetical protein ABIO46_16120 [Chitinophagales bacterium]